MSETVSPGQLRAFLRLRGWQELGESRQGTTWLRTGDDEAPAILVPTGTSDPDWMQLTSVALSRLAFVEGRSESEVIAAIDATSDSIIVSVEDPTTSAGRISFDRGVQLVESLKQLVYAGARYKFSGGRAGYQSRLPDGARAVIDQLELAPPSPGSFRVEVYAPPDPQLQIDGTEAPPDNVHDTLVSTMLAVQTARATAELERLPDDADDLDDAVQGGLSTNLLNAMIKLDTESRGLRVVFHGRWSRPDPSAPEQVTLEAHHFERFRGLRDVLSRNDPVEDFQLAGWIKGVIADELANDEHPLSGVATVETRIEGSIRDVRVELRSDELRAAREGIGEQYLSATGTLERIGREWHLTDPTHITIRTP